VEKRRDDTDEHTDTDDGKGAGNPLRLARTLTAAMTRALARVAVTLGRVRGRRFRASPSLPSSFSSFVF
jgi:hypothetical protein